MDFIVDYIFETSGFHWSKLAIGRLSCLEKFHFLAASEAGCWKNKHPKKVNKYSCKCARVSENVQLTNWINNTNLHHERYSRFLHAPRNTWCFIFVLTFFPGHFFFKDIFPINLMQVWVSFLLSCLLLYWLVRWVNKPASTDSINSAQQGYQIYQSNIPSKENILFDPQNYPWNTMSSYLGRDEYLSN